MKWRLPGRSGSKGNLLQDNTQQHAAAWAACHLALERTTPLRKDCGALCAGRCCKGGPEDGMLLFPGEEALYPENDLPIGWTVRDSEIRLPDRQAPIRLLVCNGKCDRTRRPASCRIFPLLPFVDEDGFVHADPDMRAFTMCPLLSSPDAPRIRPAFIRAVCGAFEAVLDQPGVRSLLALLAEENRVTGKFHGLDL